MKQEKVHEIMAKIEKEWLKDKDKGTLLDAGYMASIEKILQTDGIMSITRLRDGKTYLVPIEDIILLGIKEKELPSKYPEKIMVNHIDYYGLFDKDDNILFISEWIGKVIKRKEKLGYGKIFKIEYKKVGEEIKGFYDDEGAIHFDGKNGIT